MPFCSSRQVKIVALANVIVSLACMIVLNVFMTAYAAESSVNLTQTKIPSVIIQPFDDLPAELLEYVSNELKKVYPLVEINKAIPLPKTAYYKPRCRYRADIIIDYLAGIAADNQVIIGLTSKDISSTKGNNKDWGVMGLSFCPGKACIASSHRLEKTDNRSQLFKVAIHELGHTQGLNHCPEANCFMRDAKGKNTTEEEKYFCKKCSLYLSSLGWVVDTNPKQ